MASRALGNPLVPRTKHDGNIKFSPNQRYIVSPFQLEHMYDRVGSFQCFSQSGEPTANQGLLLEIVGGVSVLHATSQPGVPRRGEKGTKLA